MESLPAKKHWPSTLLRSLPCRQRSRQESGIARPGFKDKDVLIWEYPRHNPSGAQFNVVESMTLLDGLIGLSPRLLEMAKH
jgi:hypothetical protein